jgi:hypothetical protein
MKTFTIYKIYDKGLPSERKAIAREGFTDEAEANKIAQSEFSDLVTEVVSQGSDLVTEVVSQGSDLVTEGTEE